MTDGYFVEIVPEDLQTTAFINLIGRIGIEHSFLVETGEKAVYN